MGKNSGVPYKAERPDNVIDARESDEDPIWIRVEPNGVAHVVSEGPLKGIVAIPVKPDGWADFVKCYGRINEYTRDGGKLVIYGASMFKTRSLFAARTEAN